MPQMGKVTGRRFRAGWALVAAGVAALVVGGVAAAMGWLGAGTAGPGPGPYGMATDPSAGAPCAGGMMGGMMGGPGMMGGGMMGGGMMGGGMMGYGWAPAPPGAEPLSAQQVAEQVRAVLQQMGEQELRPGHIMEFDNGFYVVVEKPDGKGAFELLVDRFGRWVHPEPGPNMMWNTEYGHMAPPVPAGQAPIGAEEAVRRAQAFLDRYYPGATAGEWVEFPGYYTIDVGRDGRTFGMLSVHAYSGQVWYHSWHGAFLSETAEGDEGEHD
mgnify:CR=1 FL=1